MLMGVQNRGLWEGFVLLLVLLLYSASLSAQITWQRTYGGFSLDRGNSVHALPDGNFFVAGSTGSFGAGSSDVYVLMLDPQGEVLWSKTYGGAGVDRASKVIQAEDDGFLLVGLTSSLGAGGYDGYVLRITNGGEVVWERTFGGEGWDILHGVCRSHDGGYLLAGETYSSPHDDGDAWLLKLDVTGEMQWKRTYGNNEYDCFNAVSPIVGGYILAGATTQAGDQDAWLVKVNEDGDVEWDVRVGGDSLDLASSAIQTQDGGFAAIGSTRSYSAYDRALHFKVGPAGELLWAKNWGQVTNQGSNDFLELGNGGFVSVGYVEGIGSGGKDIFILFTDAAGEFINGITNAGEDGSHDEVAYSISRTVDGGFILCGYTDSFGMGMGDVYVVRTDSAGLTASNAVFSYFDPLVVPENREMPSSVFHPNPTPGEVLIEGGSWERLMLYNTQGLLVRTWVSPKGPLQINDLSDGMYYLRGVQRSGFVQTAPLVLQKK